MKISHRSSTPSPDGKLIALLALAALGAAVLSLGLGAVALSPAQIWHSLITGPDTSLGGRIFWYVRLPRTLAALLTGAALAAAGVVIQTVLGNPLAAPNIIGVNAGAGFAVALAAVLFPGMMGASSVLSFVGAMTAALIVLSVSQLTGASKITLILGGVMISSLFNAGIDALLTFAPNALTGYADFRVGSFGDMTMDRVRAAAWPIGISLILLLTLSQPMEILSLGEETAASLGMKVRPIRVGLLLLAAVLAGAAVSMAGIIGFVGLIVPHFVRRLTGTRCTALLLGSVFGGAAFVALCDTLSRTVFAPYELPVGIVLSFVGVPVFLWQLMHTRRHRYD